MADTYGVRPGDVVPIFIEQSVELIVAIIATLKAGAAYTPIPRDGSFSPERAKRIFDSCNATVVLSDTDIFPITTPELVVVDLRSKSLPAYPEFRVSSLLPTSTAYILWTSGTTGEPKGICISHSAAVACMLSISGKLYPRHKQDRVFQFSSPVFDVSVVDYFATLSMGATLCMMPRPRMLDDVQRAVVELRPTVASLTPSVVQLLDPTVYTFEKLILSGEIVPVQLRDRFIEYGTTVVNGYGPTEANMVYVYLDLILFHLTKNQNLCHHD
jgi:non-ribosomal peptide synthetase component F